MWPRLLVLAVLAATASVRTVDAQSGRQWFGERGGHGAHLIYGTPRSDDMVISFACNTKTVTVSYSFTFAPRAKDGTRMEIELSSEGGKVQLTATGQRSMLDDSFLLVGETRLDPVLRKILTEGRMLSIRVQGRVAPVPLAGAAKPVAELIAACG